ncbi:ChbG/HpnK family deacetylase [bacterium BFN5]|nr:ChbG/HpnK family deacetylase [bacterium BFN5]QJW46680.1 ChbG/HpnK family deacetylase [bacterium BFN5]
MKNLIINADDFGLFRTINSGIIKGFQDGVITSTSIMATSCYFDDAVNFALQNPGLGVGIHLTLVGETPVCSLRKVRSLITEQEKFFSKYPQFLWRFITQQIKLTEIKTEFSAQIEKVIQAGITPTHLDSHQHLHILPGVIDIVIELAKHYKIAAIRIPDEDYFFTGKFPFSFSRILGRNGLTLLARAARRKGSKYGIQMPDHFFGMLAGGNMSEEYLLNIIKILPNGISEIMIHPGEDSCELENQFCWNYNWQAELSAATSPQVTQSIQRNNVRLISFGEL